MPDGLLKSQYAIASMNAKGLHPNIATPTDTQGAGNYKFTNLCARILIKGILVISISLKLQAK